MRAAYDEDLDFLEDGIRRLKIEYDIYFNGHRKKPPEELRLRIEKIVRKLAEVADMNFGQRFRYNTLIARYYVYKDKFRRTMMEKESGLKDREAVPAAPKAPATESEKPQGVRVSIADAAQDEEKVRQLYDYVQAIRGSQADQPASISYQQFANYIARQTENIRGKYGCSTVEFNISLEENSIRFTARAGSQR
jgi:hypothetical protein